MSKQNACVLTSIFITDICSRLLEATPPEEDAVSLLRAAARDHVPIDPSNKACVAQAIISASQGPSRVIPSPEKRPSIESVLAEIREQEWYIGQMAYERTVDAKDGQIGTAIAASCAEIYLKSL